MESDHQLSYHYPHRVFVLLCHQQGDAPHGWSTHRVRLPLFLLFSVS